MRALVRILAGASLVAALFGTSPTEAEAQGFFVNLGGGPAFRLDDWPTQARFEEDLGWHFDGRPFGFYIALAFSQSFSDEGNLAYLFTFAPRFGYDIPVVRGRDVSFVLNPSGTFGLGVAGVTCNGCDAAALFHMTYNFDLKLLFSRNRWGLYLRPVGIEVGVGRRGGTPFGGDDAFVRYDLVFGFVFNP